MDMSPQGLAVERSFEGRALKAYKDSVGVITVGFGNTNYDKFAVAYLGGPITMATTITEDQAEYLLVETMRQNYSPAVSKAFGLVETQWQHDSGGSFHYNTGAIGRASWVKLVKAMADPAAIHSALRSWNKAGGNVLAGLTRRREREFSILQAGDYGPEGRTPPPVINGPKATDPNHHLAGTLGMLRLDDKNEAVQDYNASLVLIGFNKVATTYETRDVFTLDTQAATLAVQKAHPELVVDGIAGPATRAAVGREADAKRKLKTVATVTGTGGLPATAAQVAGWHIPGSVWIAGAVLVVIAVGWIAYRYQDEIVALKNRMTS